MSHNLSEQYFNDKDWTIKPATVTFNACGLWCKIPGAWPSYRPIPGKPHICLRRVPLMKGEAEAEVMLVSPHLDLVFHCCLLSAAIRLSINWNCSSSMLPRRQIDLDAGGAGSSYLCIKFLKTDFPFGLHNISTSENSFRSTPGTCVNNNYRVSHD